MSPDQAESMGRAVAEIGDKKYQIVLGNSDIIGEADDLSVAFDMWVLFRAFFPITSNVTLRDTE